VGEISSVADEKRSVAASALVQSTLLGELLETAQVGALAIDAGHYVAANEFACEFLGYARDELIGRRVGEKNPFSALPAQFAEIQSGARTTGEVALQRKDGTPIEIVYRVSPARLGETALMLALFWPAAI
jgi:PAS domain S-box-containing protein